MVQRGTSPRTAPAWGELEQHVGQIGDTTLREFFAADADRGTRLTAEGAGLYLDYSKQRVDDKALDLLCDLADQRGLREYFASMFAGEHINTTEDRAVLHVALRMPKGESLLVDGRDAVADVHDVLDRMAVFSDKVRGGEWVGHTGKPIKNVVNIGIGGSDLGPRMTTEALSHLTRDSFKNKVRVHYVSNVDALSLYTALAYLNPARTAFVVQSKTFTTQETMTLAASAKRWLNDGGCPSETHRSEQLELLDATIDDLFAQTAGRLQAIAIAIITRWRMPPDSLCGYSSMRFSGEGMWTRRSSSMVRSRAARRRSGASRRSRGASSRCSARRGSPTPRGASPTFATRSS